MGSFNERPGPPYAAPMTFEAFLAFLDERPDGERWELIDGEPVLNASPAQIHQLIAYNLVAALMRAKEATGAAWLPSFGLVTKLRRPGNAYWPDVLVAEESVASARNFLETALLVAEVWSKSNRLARRRQKLEGYLSLPHCGHVVTLVQDEMLAIRHDRAGDGWAEHEVRGPDGVLDLPALAVSFPLAGLYRYTPLEPRR